MSVELKRSSREGQETGDADHKLLANSPTNQTTTNNWPTHQPTKQPQRTGQLTNEPNNHKQLANSPTNQTTTKNRPTHHPTKQSQRTGQLTNQPNRSVLVVSDDVSNMWIPGATSSTICQTKMHTPAHTTLQRVRSSGYRRLVQRVSSLVTIGWCSVSLV